MGDTLGVGAARVEPIRRIAARVARSPAAGRYFAVAKSEGMRAKVEAALRKLLGDEHVVTVNLSESATGSLTAGSGPPRRPSSSS